jgi:ADP-ribose pyrophosphatase YjhB (NUDIX family)
MIFNLIVSILNKLIKNPDKGLPEPIFYFATRITPIVNVDLLIISKKYGYFLTWRNDEFAGRGWHLPGGVVRVNETLLERAKQVSINEINLKIKNITGPYDMNEVIVKDQYYRSHFVSFLFKCYLTEKEENFLFRLSKLDSSFKFFKTKPLDLIKCHYIYNNHFNKKK